MMHVGENIKRRRKELFMNAESLAEALSVAPSTIYRYERGMIDKVDSIKIEEIARVLKTTPAALMGWEDQPTSEQPSVSNIGHALSDVMRDMSEAGQKDVLQFARFILEKEGKERATHDD